jgi:hypothetical protein
LNRSGENQGRHEEKQDDVGREPNVAYGLQHAQTILRNSQEDADDHQADGVGQPDTPEQYRRQGGEQQKLDDADDRDDNAVFMHWTIGPVQPRLV